MWVNWGSGASGTSATVDRELPTSHLIITLIHTLLIVRSGTWHSYKVVKRNEKKYIVEILSLFICILINLINYAYNVEIHQINEKRKEK